MHVYIMARDELVCVIEPFTSLSIRTECDQQLAFPSTTYNSICEAPQCFCIIYYLGSFFGYLIWGLPYSRFNRMYARIIEDLPPI